MKYEVVIYVGGNLITALDIKEGQTNYISMNGNRTHPADDVEGFYKNLVNNYSVNDLSDLDVKVRVINGGTSKENIKFLNNKLSEIDEYSLWRVEDILPIIGLQKQLVKIKSKLNVSVYEKSYIIKTDNNFNITVESVNEVQGNEDVNLTLKDLGVVFNGLNGRSLSYYDNWVQTLDELKKEKDSFSLKIKKMKNELEKVIKQKDELKKMCECEFKIGDMIEFGKDIRYGNALQWRVLEIDSVDNSMIITCLNYWEKKKFWKNGFISGRAFVNGWEESDLRKWLNNDFLKQSFNEEEINRIDLIDGDRITILSLEEWRKFFPNPVKSTCLWTRTSIVTCDQCTVYLNDGFLNKSDSENYFMMVLRYKL